MQRIPHWIQKENIYLILYLNLLMAAIFSPVKIKCIGIHVSVSEYIFPTFITTTYTNQFILKQIWSKNMICKIDKMSISINSIDRMPIITFEYFWLYTHITY